MMVSPLVGKRVTVSDERPVIPLDQVEQQDTILFNGFPVVAVRLVDGRVGAVLRDMCKATGLRREPQVRRIQEDVTISDNLLSVQIRTRGGPQAADILVAWAIPYWLTTVDLARVNPEKQEAIAFIKKEGANALYAHFSQHKALALPEPKRAVVPAEPRQPGADAPALEWAEYHRQMAVLYEWKAAADTRIGALEVWQEGIESRLEADEALLAFVPEILERLGPELLTSEHQGQVQELAKQLHEASGAAYGTIYYELNQSLRVRKTEQIHEIDWPRVVQWFRTRIQAANKRRK